MKTTCLAIVLLFAWHNSLAQNDSSDAEMAQLQVKALFLYNLANFVEWAADAFDSPSAPIRMCLYGDLPFGIFLDSVDGTPIANRTLSVTRTNDVTDIAEGCHILFVGGERKSVLPEFWKNVEFLFVLSVGEQEDFSDSGGIINIFRTEDQYQFEVNISNAMAAGLFLSSDLLSLARAVHENTK